MWNLLLRIPSAEMHLMSHSLIYAAVGSFSSIECSCRDARGTPLRPGYQSGQLDGGHDDELYHFQVTFSWAECQTRGFPAMLLAYFLLKSLSLLLAS